MEATGPQPVLTDKSLATYPILKGLTHRERELLEYVYPRYGNGMTPNKAGAKLGWKAGDASCFCEAKVGRIYRTLVQGLRESDEFDKAQRRAMLAVKSDVKLETIMDTTADEKLAASIARDTLNAIPEYGMSTKQSQVTGVIRHDHHVADPEMDRALKLHNLALTNPVLARELGYGEMAVEVGV